MCFRATDTCRSGHDRPTDYLAGFVGFVVGMSSSNHEKEGPSQGDDPVVSASARGPRPRYSTYNDVARARESIALSRSGSGYAMKSMNMRDVAECCEESAGDGGACYFRPRVLFRSSQAINEEDIQHYKIKMAFDLRVPPVPCKVSHHNIKQRLSRWLTRWIIWIRQCVGNDTRRDRAPLRATSALVVDEERLEEYPRCIRCSKNSEAIYGVEGIDVYHVDLIPSFVSFWVFYQLPLWIKAQVIWMKIVGQKQDTVEHFVANMIAQDDVMGFFELYKIILAGGKKRIARSFRLFFNYDSLPAIVHCIHGKDRTGIIVALLQSLSGVPREAIIRDYAVSYALLREGRENKKLYGLIPESLQTDSVMASSEFVMEKTLDYIDETYGGVEEYLSQGGMSPSEIQQLRDVFKLGGGTAN